MPMRYIGYTLRICWWTLGAYTNRKLLPYNIKNFMHTSSFALKQMREDIFGDIETE